MRFNGLFFEQFRVAVLKRESFEKEEEKKSRLIPKDESEK